MKFEIFYHLAIMGSWQKSHDIIKSHFIKNDILKKCNKFYCCINGDPKNVKEYLSLDKSINYEFVVLRNDCTHYEFPTINFLREKCLIDDMDVLYIHTKGASRQIDKRNGRNKHLDYMCFNCIQHYTECRNKLAENYDAAGYGYNNQPFPHFSGNIWWAKSKHIKKLKKLEYGIRNFNDKEHPDRHDAEKWLCSVKGKFCNISYNYQSDYEAYTYANDE